LPGANSCRQLVPAESRPITAAAIREYTARFNRKVAMVGMTIATIVLVKVATLCEF